MYKMSTCDPFANLLIKKKKKIKKKGWCFIKASKKWRKKPAKQTNKQKAPCLENQRQNIKVLL